MWDHCQTCRKSRRQSDSQFPSSLPCFSFRNHGYTGRRISANLSYVIVREEETMERARGARRLVRYRFTFLPVPRLAAANVWICNGQRSSEISCDKYEGAHTRHRRLYIIHLLNGFQRDTFRVFKLFEMIFNEGFSMFVVCGRGLLASRPTPKLKMSASIYSA